MTPNELETLLQDLPPETIKARYRDELSSENLAFLEAFSDFDRGLANLAPVYQKAAPQAPSLPKVFSQEPSVPWYRKPFSMTPVQALMAAAALILVGFLSFYLPASEPPSNKGSWQSALQYTRSGSDDAPLKQLDRDLIESLLDRGYHFFQKDDGPGYRKALDHFLLAASIEPDNVRVLKSLVLCYQMLGDQKAVAKYTKQLEIAEEKADAP